MFGLVQVAASHIDLQQMLFARACFDSLLTRHKLTRHQGKQITGFFVWVHPVGKMASTFQVAGVHQVAVGEQYRIERIVGPHHDRVRRHDVGSVQEISDAPKPLGLALGKKRGLADVQAHQLGVFRGVAGGENFQIKRLRTFR